MQNKEQPLSLFNDCTSLRSLALINVTAAIPLFASLPTLKVRKVRYHHELTERLGYSGTIANMLLDVDFKALVNSQSLEEVEIFTDPKRIISMENLKNLRKLIIPRTNERIDAALAIFSARRPFVHVVITKKQPLSNRSSTAIEIDNIGDAYVCPDVKDETCSSCGRATLEPEVPKALFLLPPPWYLSE